MQLNVIELFDFYQYKMMQYNSLNVKLSNSQLNKAKSSIKNKTEAVLGLSSNKMKLIFLINYYQLIDKL